MGPDDAVFGGMTVSLCRRQVNHDYAFGTLLCALFVEKIPPSILIYKSKMGVHRSLGCVAGGNYYREEEEGESDGRVSQTGVLTRVFCTCG